MLSSRLLFVSLSAGLLLAAASLNACGDDPAPASSGDGGASSSSSTSSSGGSSSSSSGSTSSSSSGSSGDPGDGGGDAGCTENPQAPNLDGGEACGTLPFGKVAAQFQGVLDASDNGAYDGGTFPPGIYDAVIAERASGNPGSWRETIVVGANNRFTRIRQVDTGGGGGAGPVTHRSGTLTMNGPSLVMTFDCAVDDADPVDASSSTIPYEIKQECGKTYYRYGAAGIRIWLQRR